MAYSCKSAALLSGHPLNSAATIAAEKFGYHFGLAFQVSSSIVVESLPNVVEWSSSSLVAALLDFTATDGELGALSPDPRACAPAPHHF